MAKSVGVIVAEKGSFLLGGVTVHKSIPFTTEKDASDWVATSKEINEGAGRHVARAYTRPYKPVSPKRRVKKGQQRSPRLTR